MEIRNLTELREWAKAHGFADSWWYSVNGTVSGESVKLSKIPREGTIHILSADSRGTEFESWHCFRYPGYKTPEEVVEQLERNRKKLEPTEKQKVALEFFGKQRNGFTKMEASQYLDEAFNSPSFDSMAYREYKWSQRHRIYNDAEIFAELLERMQFTDFLIRESIAEGTKKAILTRAFTEGIPEADFQNFVMASYPKLVLSDSTRKRKQADSAAWDEAWQGLKEWEKNQEKPRRFTFLQKPPKPDILLNVSAYSEKSRGAKWKRRFQIAFLLLGILFLIWVALKLFPITKTDLDAFGML